MADEVRRPDQVVPLEDISTIESFSVHGSKKLDATTGQSRSFNVGQIFDAFTEQRTESNKVIEPIAFFTLVNSTPISIAIGDNVILPDFIVMQDGLTDPNELITINPDSSFSFKSTGAAQSLIGFAIDFSLKDVGNWSTQTHLQLYRQPSEGEIDYIAMDKSSGSEILLTVDTGTYLMLGQSRAIGESTFSDTDYRADSYKFVLNSDIAKEVPQGHAKLRIQLLGVKDIRELSDAVTKSQD